MTSTHRKGLTMPTEADLRAAIEELADEARPLAELNQHAVPRTRRGVRRWAAPALASAAVAATAIALVATRPSSRSQGAASASPSQALRTVPVSVITGTGGPAECGSSR